MLEVSVHDDDIVAPGVFKAGIHTGFLAEVTMDAYRVDNSVSSNVAEMFEERCRTIVKYRPLLERYGKFEVAIMRLFEQAQSVNCLDPVKKMFMTYLNT